MEHELESTVQFNEVSEVVPPGSYPAVVAVAPTRKIESPFSTPEKPAFFTLLTYRVTLSNGDEKYISEPVNLSFGPRSKLASRFRVLLGDAFDQSGAFAWQALVGKPCMLVVTNGLDKDGNLRDRIDSVGPPIVQPTPGAKSQAPKAEPLSPRDYNDLFPDAENHEPQPMLHGAAITRQANGRFAKV